MRQKTAFICGTGASGTNFLAYILQNNTDFIVLHEPKASLQFLFDIVDKGKYAIINKAAKRRFDAFNIKTINKFVIMRHPREVTVSFYNRRRGNPPIPEKFMAGMRATLNKVHNHILAHGKNGIIRFEKLVNDVDYANETVKHITGQHPNLSKDDLSKKINENPKDKAKKLTDMEQEYIDYYNEHMSWFEEIYYND